MTADSPTEPITIRAAKDVIGAIDAIAAALDRSRNYVVNQALRQYLERHVREIEQIRQALAAASGAGGQPTAEDGR